MAKRAAPEQQEYRPVNEQLARSVLERRRQPVEENGQAAEQDEEQSPAPPRPDEPNSEPPKSDENLPLKALPGGRKKTTKSEPTKEPIRAKRKDLVKELRMLLTESENELFEELVKGIGKDLKITVRGSNVLRACLTLLLNAQEELRKQCKRVEGPLQRPRYNEPTTIVAFEEELARIFDSAIRNTRALH